jgi:DNA-binding CsgD family transcriptional regulator
MSELLAGRLDAADDAILQARELFVATGSDPGRAATGAVFVAAWRGREDDTRRLAEEAMRSGIARGVGAQVGFAHHCLGVLELGLGRYEAASTSAQEARANGSLLGVTWTLPDLVEAAVRTKDRTLALDACAQLETSTRAGGTDWGLGMLARTQALLAKGRAADGLYREAISRLARSRASVHLARARLLYGEWLRRSRRKRDAREQLRGAHELLTSIGSLGFAERAATELAASGERRVARRPAAMELLTPHELRIARMAATGESNAEIAAQLYISRRTVEYHLHKIFRKLGLTSRAQISSALEGSSAEN